jgi:hypothetical protein
MYLGQAACGLAIVKDWRYLQFQQITPHCLKLVTRTISLATSKGLAQT